MVKGRTPTSAEKLHISLVADLGCIVCLMSGVHTPAEIHHTDGKTKPEAHFKILGLCFYHHRAGNDTTEYTSRHPYKSRFEARYGTEKMLMKETMALLE